jgi:integral membrane sensor domain MASE1
VVAAYVGLLLGYGLIPAGNLSRHPEIAIVWAVCGLLLVVIPLLAVRMFDIDPALKGRRDWTILLLFGVLINNLLCTAWGTWFLASIAPGTQGSTFMTWLVSAILVTVIVVPLGLRVFTPKVRRSKLFVRHYWD